MRCFKNYQDDRICDLCKISNFSMWEECKNDHKIRAEKFNRLMEIKEKCPYRKYIMIDYDDYYVCCPNGRKPSKSSKSCRVSFDCEKYIEKSESGETGETRLA
ncbi:MAG: hypothetical protein M0R38_11470 [Bacteroidia bacterium]|nr:hypothetical protein [Bacteroidia bacterium]